MNLKAQPKLSKAGKMPCPSYSFNAGVTCPGSRRRVNGKMELVGVCAGCYALDGNYRFPNVKAIRSHNEQDILLDGWVERMVELLQSARYFRWFDSGDCYTISRGEKILQVMEQTPWCKHWMPTKMHHVGAKFRALFDRMNALPNVVVRYSALDVGETLTCTAPVSAVVIDSTHKPEGYKMCEAYTRKGKCHTCRMCWDASISIAYPVHGRKLIKLTHL